MTEPARFQCNETRYNTPSFLVPEIHAVLDGIALDPCTDPSNPTCAERIVCLPDNGLHVPWVDRTYVNPPFGEGLKLWMAKAYVTSLVRPKRRLAVMLSVSRTEQDYFQSTMLNADAILFFNRKLPFNDGEPSMLASWMFFFNVPKEKVISCMGHRGRVR